MDIRARDTDRELLLEFSGEMDHHGARNALKEVEIAIDAALPRSLILDFAGVTFMDSSGIALILRSQQRMQLMEGSVVRPERAGAGHAVFWTLPASGGWFPFNKREVYIMKTKTENEVTLAVSQPQQQRGLYPLGGGLLCRPDGPHAQRAGGHQDRRFRGGDQRHRPCLPRPHRQGGGEGPDLPGQVLEITVRDYGRGIPDVEKARQPMFTTGGEERSGMGFTIMESFMDSLVVRSVPGRGTTVVMQDEIAPRSKR